LVKTNVYRSFDWKRAGALVDAALALPPTRRRGLKAPRAAKPAAVSAVSALQKALNPDAYEKRHGAGTRPVANMAAF
jgi:hypothetical protein